MDGRGIAVLTDYQELERRITELEEAVFVRQVVRLSDSITQRIVDALPAAGPLGLTRTQIRKDVIASNNVPESRIDSAIEFLERRGMVIVQSEPTRGRPSVRVIWIGGE